MPAGKILFFGKLADVSGASEWDMPAFDTPMSSDDFIAMITSGNANLAEALKAPSNRLCVNQVLVPPSETVTISPSDEVAFMPPMSGG